MKAVRSALLLFALPAMALGLVPGGFLYDRAAILRGEWWRLWTGHWVHFSGSHLIWNLVVLVGAGTWLERLRPGLLIRYALAAAPMISLGLLAFSPAMGAYGGLSGLATGVVVLLALAQIEKHPAERGWWLALLALTAGKIAIDAVAGTSRFSRFDFPHIQLSALAHGLGAALALAAHRYRRASWLAVVGEPAVPAK
jgi:rhomboid family GlyGly-CTERM serine protease